MLRFPWNPRKPIRGGVGHLEEPPTAIGMTGGIYQGRPPVNVCPQEAPDAIKQGSDTPARPAVMPQAILTGIEPDAVAEGRFVAVMVAAHPQAAFPRSRLTPDGSRANIAVPPHIAYGSLFTYDRPPYGLG